MMLNDFQCHFGLSVNVKRADELARQVMNRHSAKVGLFYAVCGTVKLRYLTKTTKTNMANVKSVLPLYQKLSEEWNKRSPNLDECGKLLGNLKVCNSLQHMFWKCIIVEFARKIAMSCQHGVGRFRYRTISVHTLSVHVFSVHPVLVHWMSISVQSLSVHTKYRYSPLRNINVNFGTSMFGTKYVVFR